MLPTVSLMKSAIASIWSCPPIGAKPRTCSSSSHDSSATRAASMTKVKAVGWPSLGMTTKLRQGQKASSVQESVRRRDPR